MSALPAELPRFVDDDPARLTEQLLVVYKEKTGKRPLRAHVDYVLIEMVAYGVSLVRAAINSTGWQNLVRGASGPMLDLLGQRVGVTRLPPQSARTTVRIAFAQPLTATLVIPAFTRAVAGQVAFQTSLDVIVPIGTTFIDLAMLASVPGIEANDLAPGQIDALLDDIGVDVASVANLTITTGGAVEEDDERLRAAIIEAPAAFSTAGSEMAYRFHAKRAHQDIVAVAVLSPTPGVVQLYPLLRTGLPDHAMLDLVEEVCSGEKIRPLTDFVQALMPTHYPWRWKAVLTLRSTALADTTLEAAEMAAKQFTAKLEGNLALDVVRSQLIGALSAPGVYDVEIIEPVADIPIAADGWAQCTEIQLSLADATND